MAIEQNKRHFEWDLFIAYFCKRDNDAATNESINDAQALYDLLMRKSEGRHKIFFYPECGKDSCGQFGDNGETMGTPDIIREGSKAFLLVGNGNIFFSPDKDWIDVTGRSLGDEIIATKNNRFMSYIRQNYSDSISAATTFSFDRQFNSSLIADSKGNKMLGGIECFKQEEYESQEDLADKVIAWLDDIIWKYTEFQCSDKLFIKGVPVADKHLYWVGTRQSDIAQCGDLFTGHICLFGDNDAEQNHYAYCAEKDNRIDHNEINDDADMYVFRKVCEVANQDRQALFYCYNQGLVYGTKDKEGESLYVKERLKDGTPLLDRFICLADQSLVEKYASKENFRQLCAGVAHTLPYKHVYKEDCQYANLVNLFSDEIERISRVKNARKVPPAAEDNAKRSLPLKEEFTVEEYRPRFVIQAPHGSGGVTTFILSDDKKKEIEVVQMLKKGEQYLCTIYQEDNVPVNVHAVIFKNANDPKYPIIMLSAPSIQLLHETGKRLFYRGADYKECRNIPLSLRNEFLRQVRGVCEALYREGYYGICGIDGIICNARQKDAQEHPSEHVFLMEVNTRFQASTALLNRALSKHKYPSMQHLNIHAFYTNPSELYFRELFEPTKGEAGLLDEGRPFANLEVDFANYSYINALNRRQAFHLLQYSADSPNGRDRRDQNYIVAYELDGLQTQYIEQQSKQLEQFEENAYLYRIVFSSNISWVNYSSRLYVNENILDEDLETYSDILEYRNTPEVREERMLRTKVALLIQGVNIRDEVRCIRPGTFQSVDIVFTDTERYRNYVVNSPVDKPHNLDEDKANKGIKYTGLTPFSIEIEAGTTDTLVLKYYNHKLDVVRLLPEDELQNKSIVVEGRWDKDGNPMTVSYADIAYLSTDRLRVHLTNKCKYKLDGVGCKFCGISPGNCDDAVIFTPENIQAVLSEYVNRYRHQVFNVNSEHSFRQLRHFLLGGQTANLDDDAVVGRMLNTIQTIAQLSRDNMSEIYAMIVPCGTGAIVSMKRKGLTHLAFNLEIWDDEIAEEIMPGKRGKVGCTGKKRDRQAYLNALNVARRIMGKHESVRSMLMVGLEPMENTLEGVRGLLDIDVQPMLSIFRPMPGTGIFYDYMSPQIVDVVALYHKADELCKSKRYRTLDGYIDDHIVMHLGPDCTCCQNNTVALPYKESEQRRKS